MAYTLLVLLPALAAVAWVLVRRRRPQPGARVVLHAVPKPATISGDVDPFEAIDALLAEMERAILDERDADELDALAAQLEAVAELLEDAA